MSVLFTEKTVGSILIEFGIMHSNKTRIASNRIQKKYDKIIYLHYVETLRKILPENYLIIFVFLISRENVP